MHSSTKRPRIKLKGITKPTRLTRHRSSVLITSMAGGSALPISFGWCRSTFKPITNGHSGERCYENFLVHLLNRFVVYVHD